MIPYLLYREIATDVNQEVLAPMEGLKEVSGSSESGKVGDNIKNSDVRRTLSSAKKV